jgi:hypothetical protein
MRWGMHDAVAVCRFAVAVAIAAVYLRFADEFVVPRCCDGAFVMALRCAVEATQKLHLLRFVQKLLLLRFSEVAAARCLCAIHRHPCSLQFGEYTVIFRK